MKIERTHDKFYLKESYKENPKEYYKFVRNDLKYGKEDEFSLLDIGCETGSFLYYIRKCFPNSHLYAIDVMEDLLAKVNDGIEGEEIVVTKADISDVSTLPRCKVDVVTMLGVISIFDDFKKILDNAMSLVSPHGGILYIFGIFNPEEYDVLVKAKKVGKEKWESGWNVFSIKSIEDYCIETNLSCEISPFYLEIDIFKREDDVLRSWTQNMCDGRKLVINGLQIIHNFYLIKITKKDT